MSPDPHAYIIDKILGVRQRISKRCYQNRGKQLKPRIVAALEDYQVEGTVNDLKMIGFQYQNDTCIIYILRTVFHFHVQQRIHIFDLTAFSYHALKLPLNKSQL